MVERPSLKDHRRQRPLSMADLPTYSDGLPYPEPKVVRRPLTQAVGTTVDWFASKTKKPKDKKKKAKSLPFDKKDSTSEKLLLKLFRRNFSENALESADESIQSTTKMRSRSSISSLTSSGFTPSSPPAGSLTSMSSYGDQTSDRGNSLPFSKYMSAPTSPTEQGRHPFSNTRSMSDLDLSDPSEFPVTLVDYSSGKRTSSFGSCRDAILDEADDSGLASETDLKLSRQRTYPASAKAHLPTPLEAVFVEPRSSEACAPDVDIISPQQQTIDMLAKFRLSIESLTQKAQSMDPSPVGLVPTRSSAPQRRHSSDPTHQTSQDTRHNHLGLPAAEEPAVSTRRKTSGPRPLSLIEPLDWMAFGSLPRRHHHQSMDNIPTCLPTQSGKTTPSQTRPTRLVTAVSTMDVRTPPTVMKVRASASYVDISLKINSEDEEYRQIVVKWVLETEKSYTQSLQMMMKVYMDPLRRHRGAVVEQDHIDDIFYQIPQLSALHQEFLKDLCRKNETWSELQTIGDIFVKHFTRDALSEAYSKFIGNFMNAKLTIQHLKMQRPSFAKFLEQCARDNKEKLHLGDLLIKPVQRIPRYVLFIKDLLKHTPSSHRDHGPLQQALSELTTLAEEMNEAEKEATHIDGLKDIAANIDGATDLMAPRRWLLRHDFVIELRGAQQKKDRCVLLFNDLVLCASMRRRSSFRKTTASMSSLQPDFSSMRYKFLWQAPIAVCTLSKVQPSPSVRRSRGNISKQVDQLQQDVGIVHKLMDVSKQLKCEHQSLENILREIVTGLKEDLDERKEAQEQSLFNLETSRVNLLVHANRPPTQYPLVFLDPAVKQSWEREFMETKKMAEVKMKSRRVASLRSSSAWLTLNSLEFLNPLPLQPGRMGMKLTCAGTGLSTVRGSPLSMWICRGDEYGGQVCLLNMEKTTKPRLVSSITVCSSEIMCLSFIPGGQPEPRPPVLFSSPAPNSKDSKVESEMNILDEFLDSVQRSSKDPARGGPAGVGDRGEQRRAAQEYGSQDSISTLTAAEPPRSPTPPYSPSFKKKMTTSPLALHQVSSPKLKRHRSTSPASMASDSAPKHTRSHSDSSPLFSPKQYSRPPLPPHQEESHSDTDHEGEGSVNSDELLSPLGEHFSCSLTAASKQQQMRQLLEEGPRPRSQSAPPDPAQVLGRRGGAKTVTIIESLEEISSSQEDQLPLRTSSESISSSPAKRPFSPLTLKPVSSSGGHVQVWLGTGEGVVYIFKEGDNLRSRSRTTVDLHSPVHCIQYFDKSAYVGLGSGILAVFESDDRGEWMLTSPYTLALGSEPVRCCEPVLGDLWVGRGNRIILVDTHMLTFQVLLTLPVQKAIHSLVCVDQSVWVAVDSSALIFLYHATSTNRLATVDCTTPVDDVLDNLDPIVRKHKMSCLRVTSIIHSRSSLLIGTSAGVVLQLPLPSVTTDTTEISGALVPIAVTEGHAGPVNFIASMNFDSLEEDVPADGYTPLAAIPESPPPSAPSSTLVFTGGEGFEDFVSTLCYESISDNTSCVNIWRC